MLRSIKTKLLFSHIGLIAVLAVSMGVLSYFTMANYAKEIQREKIKFMAQTIAKEAKHYFVMKEDIFKKIATEEVIEAYNKKHQYSILESHFSNFADHFSSLAFLATDGKMEFKLTDGEASVNLNFDFSGFPLFQEAIRSPNKIIVSPVERGLENKPFVRFAVAYETYFGDIIAVLIGETFLERIVGFIESFEMGKTGFAMLIDRDGNILSHPRKEKIFKKITGIEKDDGLISQVKALKTGFNRALLMGVDGFVAYTPVEGKKISVLVTLPYKEFMEAPNTVRNVAVVISMVTLIIGFFISSVLADSITSPILKIAEASSLVARGDLSQRVETKSGDEVGTLAASFNKMTRDLQKTTVSRDYVENIMSSMTDCLIVVPSEGIIQTVNKAVCDLLGYTEDELLNQSIRGFFVEEPFIITHGGVIHAVISNIEKTFISKDHRKIPVLFSGSVMRAAPLYSEHPSGHDGGGKVQGIGLLCKGHHQAKTS